MDCVGGSRSIDNTSYFECSAPCDPCFSKGSVKAASTYCKQCQEHMCVSCTSAHNGSKMPRDHVYTTVTAIDFPLSEEPSKTKPALSYCSKHGDKEIEWFCKTHEVMFCDTCKRAKHRKCVMSVSDMTSPEHGDSLEDVINALLSLTCRIAQLKSDREKSSEDLTKFKQSCKYAVQQFKSSIIDQLERLEKEILADIDKAFTTETAVVQDDVQTCDSLIPYVEAELTTAEEAKLAADDVTSVIAAYEVSKTLRIFEPTVYDLEQESYIVHITFQPSSELTDMISGLDQLGILDIGRTAKVVVAPTVSPLSTHPVRKPVYDMKVVSLTEVKVPSDCVTGSAVMADGRIILADWRNTQIILLDQEFTIQSMLTLPSRPRDVAVYGDNAAVVTMPYMKQLQYIHVDTKLRAGHTIPIGLECWAVAVHGCEIYVTVSVGIGRQVRVVDLRGKVTQSLRLVSGRISYIAVGSGGTLYITDFWDDHVKCRTNVGNKGYITGYDVKVEDMSRPCGMLVDEDDNLLVCCCKSSNIHVLGKDGAHRSVILSSADGVVHPASVSYRRSDQTLIVTMENTPSVRAYKLQ